jgi:hypothetical protein
MQQQGQAQQVVVVLQPTLAIQAVQGQVVQYLQRYQRQVQQV